MRNITKHTGKLEILGRMPQSVNGNPRFECLLHKDEKDSLENAVRFYTAPDSSFGYSIENHRGKKITVTLGTHYGKTTLNSIEVL